MIYVHGLIDRATAENVISVLQVTDIITPLIAAIWGGSSFSQLYFTVNNSRFMYGDFINQVRCPH